MAGSIPEFGFLASIVISKAAEKLPSGGTDPPSALALLQISPTTDTAAPEALVTAAPTVLLDRRPPCPAVTVLIGGAQSSGNEEAIRSTSSHGDRHVLRSFDCPSPG